MAAIIKTLKSWIKANNSWKAKNPPKHRPGWMYRNE